MAEQLAQVAFHGDTLHAVRDGDTVLVSFRRVCEALGVGMPSQLDKLRGRSWATVIQRITVAEDGKER